MSTLYFSCLCFDSLPPLLYFVVLCFVVYQIEMAIETLQKSEGLSSQRSSLLNSHVSCFYECLPSPDFDVCQTHSVALLPLSNPRVSVWCGASWFCYYWFQFTGCFRGAFGVVMMQQHPDYRLRVWSLFSQVFILQCWNLLSKTACIPS